MWLISWMVTASLLFSVTTSNDFPKGSLFYTAQKINLESNLTKYVVGCSLDSTSEVDSGALRIIIWNTMIDVETEVLNETTIIHEIDLENRTESTICGVKEYVCLVNVRVPYSIRQYISLPLEGASEFIYVGKLPPPIESTEFKCVAHKRRRLKCEFISKDTCDLKTKYKLFMFESNKKSHIPTHCFIHDSGVFVRYDSQLNDTCLYSPDNENILFELISENAIGSTSTIYNFSHYDIIKPAEPEDFTVMFLNNTNVEISWKLDSILHNVDRTFEHELLLISKYGEKRSYTHIYNITNEPINHQIGELYAFTYYEMKIRVRIIPKGTREDENDYWSGWTELNFTTTACRPYHAPLTAPGAYSLTKRQGYHGTLEVFWEEVPQYLHNGPNFEYKVFAESSTGQTFNASSKTTEMAIFHHMRTDDSYKVVIFTKNAKGRSSDTSVIHIFPYEEYYQPKIIKVLYDSDKTVYQLQWFPAYHLENLSNYTVMYCTVDAHESCANSIEIVVLPLLVTKYEVSLNRTLKFGLAANYFNYSTDLSWQQCRASFNSNISQPVFTFTDLMPQSAVLRLNVSCLEQSLVQRYDFAYWPRNKKKLMKSTSHESYISSIALVDLQPDTEYEVILAALDEKGIVHKKKDMFRTTSKAIVIHTVAALIIGIGLTTMIVAKIFRRVKKMMDIKVNLPLGLMGIDEIPNTTICSDQNVAEHVAEPGKAINKAYCETLV